MHLTENTEESNTQRAIRYAAVRCDLSPPQKFLISP